MDCLFRVKTITLETANVTNCHVIATDILFLSSNHRSVQFLYLAASEQILSAILLLPEFHCSRKLISIVSRSRPLPASRLVGHVIKHNTFWAAITWGKEQYYFAFLRSSSIMVDYIKSFGREQSRQHKQSAALRTLDVRSLNFCLKGKI